MDFSSFIGPSYTLFANKAEIQRSMNLYLERIESGAGRGQYVMYRSHGLKSVKATIGRTKLTCRGLLELNNHLFNVNDDTLYDYTAGLALNSSFGPLVNDGRPVSMDASVTAVHIVSGNTYYRLAPPMLQTPDTSAFVPSAVGVIQGIVVAIDQGNSGAPNRFYFSTDDGQTWPSLQFQTAEAYPNSLVNLEIAFQELWLFGNRRTQVYVVGGDPNAPFAPVSAGVIEMGLDAKFGKCKADNSIFLLGSNKDGDHMVWRMNGYSPVRVSNHAVENAIRSYPSHEDAIMSPYQLNGHTCLRLTFPSANAGLGATWEYDISTGMWTELAFRNPVTNRYERHRANFYVSALEKIYCGDYANGMLYEMSPDYYSDFGYPIRWERTAPHQAADGKRVQYRRFGLFFQQGTGSTTPTWVNNHSIDPTTFAADVAALLGATTITSDQATAMQAIYDWQPYDQDLALPDQSVMTPLGFYDYSNRPQVGLAWSNDGGINFSPAFQRNIGQAGSYSQRVYWTRCGMGRDRVFTASGDAAVKIAIVQAVVDVLVCLS